MTAQTSNRSKTLGFVSLFLIEMWERFGYYGMTAVIVLFMIQKLGYTDDRANLTFSAFVAMAYAMPAIGGWIGDRVLGSRRTTVLGAVVLTAGYVLLSIPIPALLFPALATVAVGGGIFKANPGNLISKLYEGESAKLDSAFTMYYMAVNLGAFISQTFTPLFAVWFGWHIAFALCAAGMVLGLVNYFFMRQHLAKVGSGPDFKPLDMRKFGAVLAGMVACGVLIAYIVQDLKVASAVVYLAVLVALAIFGYMFYKGSTGERKGTIAVLILTLQTVLFFIFYSQMSTSLTLFALRNVNLDFYGYNVPAGQVQVLNPFWIFVLSPPLAWLYDRLSKGKGDLHIASKFALGFVILSAGFFIYGLSGNFAVDGKISMWWMIWGYCLQSLGELLIGGLGLAMVSRYVGPKMRGFVMGVWFLAVGISQYAGGVVANYASVPKDVTDPLKTLPLYTNLCMNLGWVALIGTLLAIAAVPYMKWLSRTGGEAVNH